MEETELCKLFKLYGSDKFKGGREDRKCHNYSPYYFELFKDLQLVKLKFLEVGIGRSPQGVAGPSLKAWRDFFPYGEVIGADINKKLMFSDERITTRICDHTKASGFTELLTLPELDVIIEDGLHTLEGSIIALVHLWKYLIPGGIYVIEDVKPESIAVLMEVAAAFGKCELKEFGGKYDDTLITIWKPKN